MPYLFPVPIAQSQLDQFKKQANILGEVIHAIIGGKVLRGNRALNLLAVACDYPSYNALAISSKGIAIAQDTPNKLLILTDERLPTMAKKIADYSPTINETQAIEALLNWRNQTKPRSLGLEMSFRSSDISELITDNEIPPHHKPNKSLLSASNKLTSLLVDHDVVLLSGRPGVSKSTLLSEVVNPHLIIDKSLHKGLNIRLNAVDLNMTKMGENSIIALDEALRIHPDDILQLIDSCIKHNTKLVIVVQVLGKLPLPSMSNLLKFHNKTFTGLIIDKDYTASQSIIFDGHNDISTHVLTEPLDIGVYANESKTPISTATTDKEEFFEQLSKDMDSQAIMTLRQHLPKLDMRAPEQWCQYIMLKHFIPQQRAADFLKDELGVTIKLLPEPELSMSLTDTDGGDMLDPNYEEKNVIDSSPVQPFTQQTQTPSDHGWAEFFEEQMAIDIKQEDEAKEKYLQNLVTKKDYREAILDFGFDLSILPKALDTIDFISEIIDDPKYNIDLVEVPEELITYELCMRIINTDGFALHEVPIKYKDFNLCLVAVKSSPQAISAVPEQIANAVFKASIAQ